MIIATAIPRITDQFHSVADIGWYGSAYLLTTCSFQLPFGKLYTLYSVKANYLIAIFLFEIGSAVSGAAPNSIAFIVGRAIAGAGGAGITSGMVCSSFHSSVQSSYLSRMSRLTITFPDRHHRELCAPPQTINLQGHFRRRLWNFLGAWTITGWSVYL